MVKHPGRLAFTITVMVATFVACVRWFPVDLADRVVEGVRSSASAARD